jgi:hypothetical protein
MPRVYDQEAIEHAYQLYLKYNGGRHDLIELEMRKTWPGWSRQNLVTRGDKAGWPEKYGWAHGLELKAQSSAKAQLSGAESLYLSIRTQRERLEKTLAGGAAEKEDVWAHQKYCQLETDALARLRDARSRLEDFALAWEDLLNWLPEISPQAFRELVAVADAVRARAETAYGAKK